MPVVPDDLGQAQAVVATLRSGAPVTADLTNRYYTLCIPFYREFLGEHWHTGFYIGEGPSGPQDQLRMERLIATSAGLQPGSTVLDVGCGVGGPACHLARVTGATIRGLTPNPAQLDLAREGAFRKGLTQRVAFDLGDAGHLPYPDASFDAVLFFESACHFPDRPRFFAEAWRVLKPGGCLAGQDWLAGEDAELAVLQHWSERICSTWAIPALGTVADYANQMAQAGFSLELARDMRSEMDLLRGFMAEPTDRQAVMQEMEQTPDPIRRLIMQGLLVLGEAAERGAFTIGRFLARKPALP